MSTPPDFRPRRLPDRVWIVGPPGSGKSTLARRLAACLDVIPTHLDDLHWRPGWVEAPRAETAARVAEVVARRRWVVDGNYATYRTPHEARIQLWVWLDLPLRVTLPRLLRRGLHRSLTGAPCCNGNRETLRQTFLHRDSLLLFALTTDRSRRRDLVHRLAGRPHVRLRSQRAIDRFVANVARGTA